MKGGVGRSPRYRYASVQDRQRCGNTSVPLADTETVVSERMLEMCDGHEFLERVWDSASDYSAERAEINTELMDLTSQVGTPAYRDGTPQRAALDARLAALADRQSLSLKSRQNRPGGRGSQPESCSPNGGSGRLPSPQ
ncbi:hypothetical protein [Mycobacterium asiaticum]|uniref:hypothetical protein n=1 Tax=Mycobacterium asiaticum TaxID=1790 RepID=UPI003452332D